MTPYNRKENVLNVSFCFLLSYLMHFLDDVTEYRANNVAKVRYLNTDIKMC